MEELEKKTIVCILVKDDPKVYKCDIYGPTGNFLMSKTVPKDALKDLI